MSRRQLAQMAEMMDGSHLFASPFAVCRSEDIGQKSHQAWRLALPGAEVDSQRASKQPSARSSWRRQLGVGRKRNSPERSCFLFLVEELDGIRRCSVQRSELGNHAGGDRSPTPILDDDGRPHLQITVKSDRRAVTIEIGRTCGQIESQLLAVLSRQAYRGIQRHTGATPLA